MARGSAFTQGRLVGVRLSSAAKLCLVLLHLLFDKADNFLLGVHFEFAVDRANVSLNGVLS